jgi:hypothetical protein
MLMLPLLVAATAAVAPPAGAPAPGQYDAQMCVTLSTHAPTCGPIDARVDPDGTLTLRMDDIRYVLSFEQGLLIGITMHGGMQIAEFLSSYRWAGATLMFGDRSRSAQYEVQLTPHGSRKAASR